MKQGTNVKRDDKMKVKPELYLRDEVRHFPGVLRLRDSTHGHALYSKLLAWQNFSSI